MHYCSEKSWYVIRVRSQAERLVHVGLHHKQFEVLSPTYQALSTRKDRRKVLTRPIFNGYMFVRTLLNPECHLEILKTPGVVEILKSPSGPTPVPDDQVENVRLLSFWYNRDCRKISTGFHFHEKFASTFILKILCNIVLKKAGMCSGYARRLNAWYTLVYITNNLRCLIQLIRP